ncbi:MAG: hypothetical protein ABI557_10015, partial [Aureliella sp.]
MTYSIIFRGHFQESVVTQLNCKSIALDYADIGLRCNCVSPGITDIPMLRKHLEWTPDPIGRLRQRFSVESTTSP